MANDLDQINTALFKMPIRMGTPEELDGKQESLVWNGIKYIYKKISDTED